MAWAEKDHSDHRVSTPCCVQGRQPPDQAAQSHIQPGLECLQGWGIHSLLGQPVQCVTTLWVKNLFLISNLNFPCLSLKPFPLVLSLSCCKKSVCFLIISSLEILKDCSEVVLEPSLLQTKQAQIPQPFFIREILQPSHHPCGTPLELLHQLLIFLVQRALGHSTLDTPKPRHAHTVINEYVLLGLVAWF